MVDVLRRFRAAVLPDGIILDLQVIPPDPVVEVDGRVVSRIDGEGLLGPARLAAADVDAFVEQGLLLEVARDDHDVLNHHDDGADVVEDFENSVRSIPPADIPKLLAIRKTCIVRERCRLRRLAVCQPGRAS